MNTTIITTNSINKFNQLLNFLYSKKISILPLPPHSLSPSSLTLLLKQTPFFRGSLNFLISNPYSPHTLSQRKGAFKLFNFYETRHTCYQ